MPAFWHRRSTSGPHRAPVRSISPDEVAQRWAGERPQTDDADVATGSELEWDGQGRPSFLVFYASGRVERFVDDALAWQAVALLGQHAPRHGVQALSGRGRPCPGPPPGPADDAPGGRLL